jgi:hypothetical protein
MALVDLSSESRCRSISKLALPEMRYEAAPELFRAVDDINEVMKILRDIAQSGSIYDDGGMSTARLDYPPRLVVVCGHVGHDRVSAGHLMQLGHNCTWH